MKNYIREYKNALSNQQCTDIIQFFERNVEEHGVTGLVDMANQSNVINDSKKCIDMFLVGQSEEFSKFENLLVKQVQRKVLEYGEAHEQTFLAYVKNPAHSLKTSQLSLRRYNIDDGFKWHIDAMSAKHHDRVLACVFYFNKPEKGGETRFVLDDKSYYDVTPETGKMVMFPCTWLFTHCSMPVIKGKKYVATCFIMTFENNNVN